MGLADGVTLLLVLLGLWSGWMHGALHQLGRLAIVAIAAGLSRAVVVPVASFWLRMVPETHVETAIAVTFLSGFALLYFIFWMALARVTVDLRDASDRTAVDRLAGVLFGVARGAAVAFVLVVGLLYLSLGTGRPRITWSETRIGRAVLDRDLLDRAVDDVYEDLQVPRPRLPGFGEDGLDEGPR